MGKDIQRGKGFESEESESVVSDSTDGKLKHSIEEQELNDLEGGPTYWEHLDHTANVDGARSRESGAIEFREPLQANPDGIIDDAEQYVAEREEYGEKLSYIKEKMNEVLAPAEFKAMQLLQQGFTYDKIAFSMAVTKATVQVLIERARQKLLPYLSLE